MGPGHWAKSKTELGNRRPLRQMKGQPNRTVRRISRLIRQMRAPWLGPLEKMEDRGFVPLRAGQVLIGVLDFSRRTNARHRNLFSPFSCRAKGQACWVDATTSPMAHFLCGLLLANFLQHFTPYFPYTPLGLNS